jgi:arylsulfatase A-like enzyme
MEMVSRTRYSVVLQSGKISMLVMMSIFMMHTIIWGADEEIAQPNILLILADDLGWADIGFHESDTLTPNIDRLANGGVRLEQHYVWPTCSPTRVALLTGREPSRFGVLTPLGDGGLPPETVTLPASLRDCGYSTHITGKWHIGAPPDSRPLLFGFDTSYGYFRGQIDPYTHHYKTGARTWHRNDQLLDEPGHATDLIAAEAIRVIRSAGDKPFFLYTAFSVPHYPLSEPSEWTSLYDGEIEDRWRKLNAASISHMDDAIGRIVETLEESGLRENTLIVFTSDNGGQQSWNAPASQYEGRYEPHTTLGNNLPLRGWKTQLYEGGIRVPCCVNWPGCVPSGKIIDDPVCIIDWMPTFLELVGRPGDESDGLSGRSIWPLILSDVEPQQRTFYWRTPGRLALRHGDWKLLAYNNGANAELYNLVSDPYETRNLAEMHPERVAELTEILNMQREADGDYERAPTL